jgi:hypothetical protein
LTSSFARHTGYVGEGSLDLIFAHQASLALAERHGTLCRRPASGRMKKTQTPISSSIEPGDEDGRSETVLPASHPSL